MPASTGCGSFSCTCGALRRLRVILDGRRFLAILSNIIRHRTTKPEPGRKIFRQLLCDVAGIRPNQVWAKEIADIAAAKGIVTLAVVTDWFSRRVLWWRVTITIEADFGVAPLTVWLVADAD